MHKGGGTDSNSTAGPLHHGSWGHVAAGGKTCIVSGAYPCAASCADSMLSTSMNSCMLMLGREVFGPMPASCTTGLGAKPAVVAAARSCVRHGFSSWHGEFVGPILVPEFCVPFGCAQAASMLSTSMNSRMLMPGGTANCPAGRASCTVGSGAMPPISAAAALCCVRLGRGAVGHRTFVGPNGPEFCAMFIPKPSSCTTGLGAMPADLVAAPRSCVKSGFSSGQGNFVDPIFGPDSNCD